MPCACRSSAEGSEALTTAPMALLPGWARASFSTDVSTSLGVREQKWTVAPSERKLFTMARPMPFVPPGL